MNFLPEIAPLRELLHPDKRPLGYSLARATLPVDETSQLHLLTTSEVYYILSGKGTSPDETQLVEPGDAVYILPIFDNLSPTVG